MRNIFLIFAFTLGISSTLFGQDTTLHVLPDDTVSFSIENHDDGEVIWESANSLESDWSPIEGATTSYYDYVVSTLPIYIRGSVTNSECIKHTEVTELLMNTSNMLLWSDPNTWGGTKPVDGEDVVIPAGQTIYLDENTANLAGLNISGTLEFLRQDLELTADHILVMDGGLLQIGTESQPFEEKAVITLNGTNTSEDANTRGIVIAQGGVIEIHGATPEVIWTKIDGSISPGDTQIKLLEAANWPVGSEIVLAPTDYYRAGNGVAVTQKFTVTAVNNDVITVDHPSQSHVWGELQYITSTGVSTNASEMIPAPHEGVPTVIDERAEIGLLTRNVVIQSADDQLWQNSGFGAHTMTMRGGISRFEGVEFHRVGQAGHMGRYPAHTHMQNIGTNSGGDKVYIDTDVDPNEYIKRSAVHTSMNRGLVIHGTWHQELSDNVIYDVRGHGIFLEDGSERKNKILRNLVLMVRDPAPSAVLLNHESVARNGFGSSGTWYTNPDNDLVGNAFADCPTFGIWASFSFQAWGESVGVKNMANTAIDDNPSRTAMGLFADNVVHSCRFGGIRLDDVQRDGDGNTIGHFYRPSDDGLLQPWPHPNTVHFLVEGGIVYKNGGTGVWDRSSRSIARGVVNVDNAGRYFAGAGAEGLIEKCLVVSKTQNIDLNGTYRPLNTDCAAGRCNNLGTVAFASYHYGFEFDSNLIVGFNLDECADGERCGTFDLSDLYIRAVEEGPAAFVRDNILIDSHGGVKLHPPSPYTHFTLSGAVSGQIHGYDSGYFVYNDAFHTAGLETAPVEPVDKSGGVMAFGGRWSGIRAFILDGQNEEYNDYYAIDVNKFEWENNSLTQLGSWSVDNAPFPGILLDHMRDAALNDQFVYTLDFPEDDAPQNFSMLVDNLIDDNQIQRIGIEFEADSPPSQVYMFSWGRRFNYVQVETFEEVANSTTGKVWWLDTENNRVWVAMKGGEWQFYTDPAQATPEDRLYETTQLRIEQ